MNESISYAPIHCQKCGKVIGEHSLSTQGTIRIICTKAVYGSGRCKTLNTIEFNGKSHTQGKNVI